MRVVKLKTYSRKTSGIVNSIEIMLILSAVMAIAFIAMLGLGRNVMNQAASTKAMVAIHEPQGWYYGSDSNIRNNPIITVSLSITNMGDKDVRIDNLYILITSGCKYDAGGIYVTVHPGETVIESFKTSRTNSCNMNIPTHADLFVRYTTKDGRTNVIQQPIVLTHA